MNLFNMKIAHSQRHRSNLNTLIRSQSSSINENDVVCLLLLLLPLFCRGKKCDDNYRMWKANGPGQKYRRKKCEWMLQEIGWSLALHLHMRKVFISVLLAIVVAFFPFYRTVQRRIDLVRFGFFLFEDRFNSFTIYRTDEWHVRQWRTKRNVCENSRKKTYTHNTTT